MKKTLIAFFLVSCHSQITAESAEDAICKAVADSIQYLPAGPVKNGAIVTKVGCDAEERLEKSDGGK